MKRYSRPDRHNRLSALNQLNFIAVRVLDKGDYRGAMLHRTRLPGHLAAAFAHLVAGLGSVVDRDGNMAVTGANFVLLHPPIIGKFEYGFAVLVTITDKSEGKFAVRVVVAP